MDNEKLIKVDFPGMNCQIAPYESSVPLETAPGYRKLDTSISQTGQISALFREIPTLAGAELTRKAYIVKFPKGVRGEMIKLKQGGRGTPLQDPATGKFTGTASLYPVNTRVAVVYGFSAMSVVSGQYFLAEINQQMNRMNQSLDKILEFLYGEKRAELMAEANRAWREYMRLRKSLKAKKEEE